MHSKKWAGVGHVSIFWIRLPFVGVTIRLGFCASGKFVRCNEASRQYLNLSAKMEIMDGLLNSCTHRSVTYLGLLWLGMLGDLFGGSM